VNRFPELAAKLRPAMSQIVRKVAFDIEANAAADAPVDTGFLKSSIYTVTSKSSDYGNAGSPPGDSSLLQEVEAPGDDLTAYVAVGANYGIYVEYGTRYMAAQPYFIPAVEAGSAAFEQVASQLESLLAGGSL
jgi:HK97 gp10 family phage protein